jgi:hypothetical protein
MRFRQLNFDHFGSLSVGRCGWDTAEVLVFESVAVACRAMTSPWWTRRSIMAAATTSSPTTTPAKGLLLVTIRDGRFVACGLQLEEQVRVFGFEPDVAHLVDHRERVAPRRTRFGLAGVRGGVRLPGVRPMGMRSRTGPGVRPGSRGSPSRWRGGRGAFRGSLARCVVRARPGRPRPRRVSRCRWVVQVTSAACPPVSLNSSS